MKNPLSQGRLDGLCGLYSTINAFDYLFPGITFEDAERLFKHLIIAKRDLFPAALYDGTDIPDVRDWIHEAANFLKKPVDVAEPFRHTKFSSTEEYLDHLAELVKPEHTVAIVGLGKPWEHWTVIKSIVGNTVHFHDSYGLNTRARSWFDIQANERKTRIVTKETVIISAKY